MRNYGLPTNEMGQKRFCQWKEIPLWKNCRKWEKQSQMCAIVDSTICAAQVASWIFHNWVIHFCKIVSFIWNEWEIEKTFLGLLWPGNVWIFHCISQWPTLVIADLGANADLQIKIIWSKVWVSHWLSWMMRETHKLKVGLQMGTHHGESTFDGLWSYVYLSDVSSNATTYFFEFPKANSQSRHVWHDDVMWIILRRSGGNNDAVRKLPWVAWMFCFQYLTCCCWSGIWLALSCGPHQTKARSHESIYINCARISLFLLFFFSWYIHPQCRLPQRIDDPGAWDRLFECRFPTIPKWRGVP